MTSVPSAMLKGSTGMVEAVRRAEIPVDVKGPVIGHGVAQIAREAWCPMSNG